MYNIVLMLHLLSATVWTGGHLVLATTILPQALKTKDISGLMQFEQNFEKVGIPALIIQVSSGVYLAHSKIPEFSQWFDWANPVAALVSLKLALLGITFALAVDARLRVIPNLSVSNLNSLALHIIPVTIVSVLFVFVGLSFRTGWMF